jgi:hypothetical protein
MTSEEIISGLGLIRRKRAGNSPDRRFLNTRTTEVGYNSQCSCSQLRMAEGISGVEL